MRALLLCLFLAACASPERHELRDGVPVRPAPVFVTPGYTPEGAGLPEYMPGPPEPMRIEPNPRPTRLLPQTPETASQPGIWASSVAVPQVLGVPLPLPPVDEDPQAELTTAFQCAKRLDFAVKQSQLETEAQRLQPRLKQCLVALLYEMCSGRYLELVETPSGTHVPNERATRRVLKTLGTATAFRLLSCGDPTDPKTEAIADAVMDYFPSLMEMH